MTLTELRYILAVAREGHFGRAAKACFVSQPTLSLGIKKLEDELGVQIFERRQKDIVITPIGRKIIDKASRALKDVKGIKDLVMKESDPLRAPLRLGAIYTVGPYLFPALLPVIRERTPQLPLIVEENYTANLTDKLKNGDIDLALLSLPFDEPGFETLVIYREPFVLMLPASHPLVEKNKIELTDLHNETVFLLGPQHCFRNQILEIWPHCAKNLTDYYDLQSTFSGSSIETIRYMVASGAGVTILPYTAACIERYKPGLLEIRHIDALQSGREIILAQRKNFPREEAVEAIVKSIQKCSLSGVEIYQESVVIES